MKKFSIRMLLVFLQFIFTYDNIWIERSIEHQGNLADAVGCTKELIEKVNTDGDFTRH